MLFDGMKEMQIWNFTKGYLDFTKSIHQVISDEPANQNPTNTTKFLTSYLNTHSGTFNEGEYVEYRYLNVISLFET